MDSRLTSVPPLLVSFYQDTKGTNGFYKKCADRLKFDCERLGQPAHIVRRNYGKDYLAITRGKPKFMLEQLLKHKRDILFVDVDTVILKKFDFWFDTIAWASRPDGKPFGHIHYLPYNDDTIRFLDMWIKNCEDWQGGDHSAMWLTVKQNKTQWQIIPNVGARARYGISDTDDNKKSVEFLKSIDWNKTVQEVLRDN